jgi:hypothetical protein
MAPLNCNIGTIQSFPQPKKEKSLDFINEQKKLLLRNSNILHIVKLSLKKTHITTTNTTKVNIFRHPKGVHTTQINTDSCY